VDWVLEKSLLHTGVKISGNQFLDIDYADDIATLDADPVSLAATYTSMECLLRSWSAYLVDKDQGTNIGVGSLGLPAQTIRIDGQQVEGVENLTYLGNQLSSVDGSRTEQRHRVGIAVSTMQRILHVWSLSHLTLITRLRLYMSFVVPTLLYASKTWTTTGLNLARLQSFHMRCQRRILGVYWYEHVTNIAVARNVFS